MFLLATRQKFRWSTSKGDLSVEQLWDVPLRSSDDFNLDIIARGLHKQVEDASKDVSFVDGHKPSNIVSGLEARFEIVREIIGIKLNEENQVKTKAANKLEREKLLTILAEKQEGKLSELSEKELQKRIKALGE